jgi:hypothetical protein
MVLMGCSQAPDACETIATLPVAYASESSCLESRSEILSLSPDLGYARVTADCRPQGTGQRRDTNLRTNPSA